MHRKASLASAMLVLSAALALIAAAGFLPPSERRPASEFSKRPTKDGYSRDRRVQV